MTFSVFPRTLYSIKSPINGEIKVVEQWGKHSLRVGGLEQSGPMVKSIWKKALRGAKGWNSEVRNCLILGLGGGTAVQLIAGHSARPHFFWRKKVKPIWPGAKIIGVELDPKIIKVGKKFFGLKKVEGLKIIKANAFGFFKMLVGSKKFDLVLVDLYLGDQFPKEAEDEKFLRILKKVLTRRGVVVFNRLRTDKTEAFEKTLKKHFSQTEVVKTPANLFFLARS